MYTWHYATLAGVISTAHVPLALTANNMLHGRPVVDVNPPTQKLPDPKKEGSLQGCPDYRCSLLCTWQACDWMLQRIILSALDRLSDDTYCISKNLSEKKNMSYTWRTILLKKRINACNRSIGFWYRIAGIDHLHFTVASDLADWSAVSCVWVPPAFLPCREAIAVPTNLAFNVIEERLLKKLMAPTHRW